MSNNSNNNGLTDFNNPFHARMMPSAGVTQDPAVSVADALKIISARQPNLQTLYVPNEAPAFGNSSSDSMQNVQSIAAIASNTVSGPPSIAELARALKNDPDLIFAWVHDNIEYTPTFGEQKGAAGCLFDGIGNDFDQSALLAALLTQAGYAPSLVFGNVEFNAADFGAWFGTDPTDLGLANFICSNGGIPVQYTDHQTITFPHVWVQVALGGTTYYFDPSYKTYTTTSPINLVTATGYTQAGLVAQATVGATIDPGDVFVQNMNRPNVRTQLATYSTNLISYIKTNNPTATLDDVLGGRKIVPVSGPIRVTSFSYQIPGDVPVIWSTVPNSYRIFLTVQCADINVDFYGSDVHEQRLTIFFNASSLPVLSLNGVVVATGTFVPSQFSCAITHPYSFTNANQTITELGNSTRSFLIGLTFGPTGTSIADYWQNQFAQNVLAGGAATSEPVLGCELAAAFYSYFAQVSKSADMAARIGNCASADHHAAGFAYWDPSGAPAGQALVHFNVGGIVAFLTPLVGSVDRTPVASMMGHNSHVIEMAAISQTYGVPAIGPTRVVDYGNQIGLQTLKITPANQGTTLPLLSGYDSSGLAIINSGLAAGNNIYLPKSAPETIGSVNCQGSIEVTSFGGIFGWLGANKGGLPEQDVPNSKPKKKEKKCEECEEADPVVVRTGDYRYEQSDITVGSATFPYSLEFRSMYDSREFNFVNLLGRGWSHNWNIQALIGSNGIKGLGSDSPLEAAASIVEMLILQDLYTDLAYPLEKIVLAAMCAQWWSDSLYNNIVTVNMPIGNFVFTLLQDGTYNPTLNRAETLSLAGGLYQVTTPDQQKLNFDASGNLSTWVFPFGVTITLGYTAGLLSTISNGLGRQLTLAYTGGFLSSVSDGNGRSVTYAVNGTTKQLGSITNPLSHATTFSYDTAGRFLSYFLPQNPANAMVINSYDSLNRISSQLDVSGNLRTFYLAGSRSEIVDPALHSTITYYDEHGEVIQQVDELGNATTYVMDGLKRLVKKTMPEGNYVQYVYDNAHGLASRLNILTETKVAKSGSGLGNIVSTWTYDATYNKPHTLLDPRSNTWTWNYDPATGNLLSFIKPVVGGLTPQESWTYNSRGQVLTYTDETSLVTQYNYDVATEKLNSVVVDFGIAPHLNLTTSLGYDTVGNVTSRTDPNGNQTILAFDNDRRLTQRTAPAPFNYVTKYGFDFNNNVTSIQRQVTSTPTFQTYTIAYTLFNKVATVTDPAGNVTTKTYDVLDRLWTVKDAENRLTTFSYDARSKLSTVLDATGTISETRLYTNNGLLASIKDARNNLTQYTRDGFDRLDKTIYADASFEENQAYDANGNVLTYRTRSGNTIVNTFDALNRLSTKTPTGQAVVTFGYDLHNRLLSESTPVVANNPASGNFQFSYDTAGRLKQETTPDSKNTQYQLDSSGNLTKLTYPDGYFATRIYDQLNRLTDIKLNGASTAAVHLAYDQLSRRSVLTYGNGATSTYTFQLNDDLTGLAEAFTGSSVAFTYGFNKVHQETSLKLTDGSYLWHPAVASNVAYTANSVNEYPTIGGVNYSYDGNANLAGDGTWTYTFDTENHLLTANKTGVSASYVYDPSHRQIQKTVGAAKTRYVYSGWQRIADYDGAANTLQNRYVYGVGLDEPLIQVSTAGVLTYLHADRQGSIIATSDSTGTVTNKSKYSPFGENAPVGTTFGFTGQRYDAETGLYYYKNRHYSSAIGRFLQTDPIGYGIKLDDCGCGCSCSSPSPTKQASVNLYGYVGNDPLNNVDPRGLLAGAVGAVAVAVGVITGALTGNPLVGAATVIIILALPIAGDTRLGPELPPSFEVRGGTKGECIIECSLQAEEWRNKLKLPPKNKPCRTERQRQALEAIQRLYQACEDACMSKPDGGPGGPDEGLEQEAA